jgi:hypothetical protein
MALSAEDLEDQAKYRQILKIPYSELVEFVLDYIWRRTRLMVFFWSVCILFLGIAITVRINISEYFQFKNILFHSILGFAIFPVLCIPVHEFLHIIPFLLSGAKRIRIGIDLKQYIFYVTAHKHVTSPKQFSFIALVPFIVFSVVLLILIYFLPGLWKWSLSVLLFVHTTMCAGDFAMMNFFHINRHRKIYTCDDTDRKESCFYEEI